MSSLGQGMALTDCGGVGANSTSRSRDIGQLEAGEVAHTRLTARSPLVAKKPGRRIIGVVDLDELARAGRAAWPAVSLGEDEFLAFLVSRAQPVEHAADLYLAHACARGAAGALAAFEATLLSQVPGFLRRMSPQIVDEVCQRLRDRLFVGAAPKIAEYSGSGPLAAWLRVVALRLAIDLSRSAGQNIARELDAAQLAGPAGRSPELEYLKERYRLDVKGAFQEALLALSSEQRNVLRLHLVEGLTLEEIGRLFHVNRSTVFRWLGASREALLADARLRLRERIGVSADEFDSLVQVVRSQLDLSLAEVLKTA